MPKMVITHNVVDVDNWLQYKAERAAAIRSSGGLQRGRPRRVRRQQRRRHQRRRGYAAAMMAALASPPAEVAAAMERHGVVPPLTAFVEG